MSKSLQAVGYGKERELKHLKAKSPHSGGGSRKAYVLDSDGNPFTVPLQVIDSDGNEFTVPETVLDSDGNPFDAL